MQRGGEARLRGIAGIVGLGVFLGTFVKHPERAHHEFLCARAGQDAHVHAPVEAQRTKHGLHSVPYVSQIGLLLLLRLRKMLSAAREVAEQPHGDARHENDAAHLAEVLPSLLPRVAHDARRLRRTVGRDFHHERTVRAAPIATVEHGGCGKGYGDAEGVEQAHHVDRLIGEKRAAEYHVDRQPRRARHEGQHQHREQPRLAVLYRARGHHGRHVAAEAHEHRNERLAVQPHAAEQGVGQHGGAGQVARVFEQGDAEVEDEDIGQEHDDAPHAAQHAADQQVAQEAVGQRAFHQLCQKAHAAVNPIHGILSQFEGEPEGAKHQRGIHEVGVQAVRREAVEQARGAVGASLVALIDARHDFRDAVVTGGIDSFHVARFVLSGLRGYRLAGALGALDGCPEGFRDALSRACNGGHAGHAEPFAQPWQVESAAALREFVVHVEHAHHGLAHRAQLHGEQQVALEVVHVDHVEHHVHLAFRQLVHHVCLVGAERVERVSAGQVDDAQFAAVEFGMSLHARHGHAGIVARAFVSAAGGVEEGRFAAVGVAHEGDGQRVLAAVFMLMRAAA